MSKPISEKEVLNTKYGRLKPIAETEPYTWVGKTGRVRKKRMFRCICDCGNNVTVSLEHLRSGHTNSCGCYAKDLQSDCNTIHGKYKGAGNTHPLHNLWRAMITRITTDKNYTTLQHSEKFLQDPWYFYSYIERMLGDKPEGYSLDRKDTNKGYIEGNLRWADAGTQARNTRAIGGSSKYKGVCFYKHLNKWVANIYYKGHKYYLGLYISETEAAKAYVRKWLELEGLEVSKDNLTYYVDYFRKNCDHCLFTMIYKLI